MPARTFDIIVCTDSRGGIGKNGTMPWRLGADMRWFKKKTTALPDSAVIMGRRTWESLPPRFRPLSDRRNIVLSGTIKSAPGAFFFNDFESALKDAYRNCRAVFIIGGATLYKTALSHPAFSCLWLTRLEREFSCDTFFPDYSGLLPEGIVDSGVEDGLSYSIRKYKNNS